MYSSLHNHTMFSLLDGYATPKEYLDRAAEAGINTFAITEHGNEYSWCYFEKLKKNYPDIKIIYGVEFYECFDISVKDKGSKYFHLVVLARNENGRKAINKLVTKSNFEGFYYKPRVDLNCFRKLDRGKDIIVLSACLASKIACESDYQKCVEYVNEYKKVFPYFYLEIQSHSHDEQKIYNQKILSLAKYTNTPYVITTDSHAAKKEDLYYQGRHVQIAHDSETMSETYEGCYLQTEEEIHSVMDSQIGEEAVNIGLLTTNVVAGMIDDVKMPFQPPKLPTFPLPKGFESDYEYLKHLVDEGWYKRGFNKFEEDKQKKYRERIDYELGIIHSMSFDGYFLIVWDFINYAKSDGIMVGPGRGSCAGSLVCYAIGVTDLDPIKYGLIFERFLNPERVSMPDIDIDFCYERRQEVIDYVVGKYGADHVAQIVTFGTMAARNAIRDVGRALAMSYSEVDKIAKMIPMEHNRKVTIKNALEMNPELLSEYENFPKVKYLLDMSMRLEGLPRHASTHAAGVVICDRPVVDYVPLNSNEGVITTQYTMTTLEELGLLKMDFLGLRTLTVIHNAIIEVERNHKVKIDVSNIDYDDKNVFALISSGKTDGVFQLESPGMRQFMRELQPSSLEDIIAGISLYRPGPMDFIPKYIKGKNNKDSITYTHPALEKILEPTYGCIVYQEQVMQIVRELAGYSLGRSDLVRRAMSKKKTDVMARERKNFIEGLGDDVPGCIKNGIEREAAEKIFDEMTDFAKYAFNKSHAAAYAIVAYQTAYLRTYYPVEFMAALMTSVMSFPDKISEYIAACRKMSIQLLPPDINESFHNFSVSGGKIRYSLSAIKNVGAGNVKALVLEREKNGNYISMTQFLNRLSGELNTRTIESLIKAGAFDSLGGKRSQYAGVYKQIYNGLGQVKKRTMAGQVSLFEMTERKDEEVYKDELPNIEEYPKKLLLSEEKAVLGIYVSGHPLFEYKDILEKYITFTSVDFSSDYTQMYDGQ